MVPIACFQRSSDYLIHRCLIGSESPATITRDASKCAGSVRPRFRARLRMPLAARADIEYFSGTSCGGSRISVSEGSDDEHPSPSLRHSEVAAVENPPGQAVPELGQRCKHDSEVPTALAREETWNVLHEEPAGSKSLGDSGELEEEAGALADEPCSSSGDREVLAGGAACEEVNTSVAVLGPCPIASSVGATASSRHDFGEGSSSPARRDFTNVLVDGDSGEEGSQHVASVGVGLAKEGVAPPCSGEAAVEAADA